MATKWYAAHSVNPADDHSIQNLPNPGAYTELNTGDMCISYDGGHGSLYRYDSTDSTTEEIPARITPTGNSGPGRWQRKRVSQVSYFFNGTLAETFDALVTSNGSTVTLALEKVGGGDLTAVIPGDVRVLPAQSIALTPGSDVSPTGNYIYVLASTPTVLSKSTSDWPSANHIKIAYCLVPSATYVQSDGCYVNQNWNDGTDSTGIGQLTHMGENIRLTLGGASWHSGVAGNGATDDYITIVTGDTPDSIYFLTTAGICYQMHKHTVPAFNSQTDTLLVVNSNTGAYTPRNDLSDETVDASGGTLANKYFNLVFWMVANKTGEYAPCMVNMPTGTYTGLSNATNDVDGYDVYDMPREFKNESATGFLICRVTFRNQAGNWTVENTTDLRGRTPGTASGVSGGAITEFADNQFKLYNVADITKIVDLDISGLTTGNTRTITPADADMKIPSSVNHDALTDGGDTDLHKHDTLDYSGAAKATAVNGGVTVTGTLTADRVVIGDNEYILLGVAGAPGTAVQILFDGSDLTFLNGLGTEVLAKMTAGGSVELRNNNTTRLETDGAGVTISGNIIVSGTVDGIDIASDTGLLATAREWTAQQNFNELAITSTSNAVAWNLNTAQCALHTLTENTTISAPSNLKAGSTYNLRVVQAAGAYTLAWNSAFKWGTAATPAAPAANGDVVIFSFYTDGTNVYGAEMNRTEA